MRAQQWFRRARPLSLPYPDLRLFLPLLLLNTWEVCQPARRRSRLVLPSEGLHLCSLLLASVFFSLCVCVSLSSGGLMRISCGARSSHSWVVVNKNQQHPRARCARGFLFNTSFCRGLNLG